MNIKYFAMTALAFSLLAGCQSTEPEETAAPEPASTTPVAEQPTSTRPDAAERRSAQREPEPTANGPEVDPSREIPNLDGRLESEGYGMTMIVDGSSPQAFADSLEMIASDTSSEQYQALDSAIRYLQAYSLEPGNLEALYRSLDGLTAEEIIERAQSRHQ